MSETKILIALDGSMLSERAAAYVGRLRPLGDLRVRLLSVLESYDDLNNPEISDHLKQAKEHDRFSIEAYLQTRAVGLREPGVAVEVAVTEGAPGSAIISDARDFGAQLIIISTHGKSGFEEWRFGGVADKVIRGAGCDTLVLGPRLDKSRLTSQIREILVPLDGSDLAEEAIPVAKRFASAVNARLHLVRVVPNVAEREVAGPNLRQVLSGQMLAAAERYLNDVANNQQLSPEQTVMVGSPASELRDYSSQRSIDLIMMTSRGGGGADTTALGSVADRLIGGTVPVYVVRRLQREITGF